MMRNPGDINQQGVGRPAHGGGRECRLPAYRYSMIVVIVAFLWRRPNWTMFRISLAYLFGSAKKQMNTFIAYLRVVRLSLALPGKFARDAPSLSRHPNHYGMEPASPDRLSPRASIFASASSFSRHPPSARFPSRPGG